MAVGDSATSICNIGMIELGEDPISDIQTEPSKAAILCRNRFDQVRRFVLRDGIWNCAKRQGQLAQSTTAPLFTYSAAYPTPSDFLRMLDLPENDEAVWELMNLSGVGQCICTNEGSPLNTLYTFDLTDPTVMDPLLAEAIGYRMGFITAMPLTQDKALRDRCEQLYEDTIEKARLAGSQENSVREFDADLWLRRRR